MVAETNNNHVIYKYLRSKKKFPSVWCAGCGIGTILGALIRAIDRLGLEKDDVALISGIGCSGRLPVYVDFNTLHTTHGRALAFATGLKLARPKMEVIVIMGDGDALAIGGNHFIHAARRNIDMTAIVINNSIYGMTGGQVSPATPTGDFATTAPYGNIEQPFDIARLAEAAGAVFVARSTAYHAMELDKLFEQAIVKKGFAVVEAISQCPVSYGKMNRSGSAVDMLRWQKDNTMRVEAWGKLPVEERAHKISRGVLVNREGVPEYVEEYYQIIERAKMA